MYSQVMEVAGATLDTLLKLLGSQLTVMFYLVASDCLVDAENILAKSGFVMLLQFRISYDVVDYC